MREAKHQKQCDTCPWRMDCDPEKDIPNGYSCELHKGLRGTIASDASWSGTIRAMACHYSPVGKEIVCVGWLHNQIGEGNNIGARLAVMSGNMPVPDVVGKQHRSFDDTLPRKRRPTKEKR